MTDKELHKLSRRDLLQLMLESAREAEKAKARLQEAQEQIAGLEESYERLRKRLDEKDSQIHNLKDELEEIRKRREIELQEAGSIAEASLRLNGVFEAAQKAAEQYIYNVRRLHDMQSEDEPAIQTMEEIRINAQMAGRERQRDMHGQEEQGDRGAEQTDGADGSGGRAEQAVRADGPDTGAEQNDRAEERGDGAEQCAEAEGPRPEGDGNPDPGTDRGGAAEGTA